MGNNGWIKLYRKIKDNALWQDKPFSKGQAWIDILLEINHSENEFLLGNEVVKVNVGEKITSIRKLCDDWGWSNTKVKNFLNLLQKQNMITYKSDTKKTVIKVLNYSDYQHSEKSKNTSKAYQKHIKNTSKTYQKHTNKNVKNDKNEKKSNSCSELNPNEVKFDEQSMPYKASIKLRKYIKENNPRQPLPNPNPEDMHKWSVEMDRLNRLGAVGGNNGYTWTEIRRIMDWCQQDEFWRDNILSASKFRKQIIKLENKMKKDKNYTSKRKMKSTVNYDDITEMINGE